MRPSGRAPDIMRPVSIETGIARHAEGSARIAIGGTEVTCSASVETKVPQFLRGQGKGWITAEYGMLPRATHRRGAREATKGRQTGRTQEIQRLIGRALRASVDLRDLGEIMITLDCDVLNADGGTRCASVTGAWVALAIALRTLAARGVIRAMPAMIQIAAISCGITDSGCVLDLDYDEDSTAAADANFVLAADGGIVEIQGTAERTPFGEAAPFEMMRLARLGTGALFTAQTQAMEAACDAARRI